MQQRVVCTGVMICLSRRALSLGQKGAGSKSCLFLCRLSQDSEPGRQASDRRSDAMRRTVIWLCNNCRDDASSSKVGACRWWWCSWVENTLPLSGKLRLKGKRW